MPAIWRNVNRFNFASLVAVASVCLVAPVALAEDGSGSMPAYLMHWDASNDAESNLIYNPNDFADVTTSFGTWNMGGGPHGEGGPAHQSTGWRYRGHLTNTAWSMNWDCVINRDPFVDATINVTNNSGAFQTFVVFMPLGIVPQLPATLMTSSVSAVLVDADFDGPPPMLITDGVSPIFRGYIDNVQQSALWNPGYSLVAPQFGSANDTTSIANQPGPPALSTIAVRLTFRLSPGDSASVTGIFDIHAAPGVAGLPAFAIFGAMVSRRRRQS